MSSPLPLSLHHASYQHCLVRCHSASPNAARGLRAVSVSGLSASLAALTQLPRAMGTSHHMEFASSLREVCPRTFTRKGWPRFREDGLAFWCKYFAHLPWDDGWHTAVGRELGRRIRRHAFHDQWKAQAFDWAQESVRHEHRPEETAWMTWLRRQDCNYTRYQHVRRQGELLMTQWGDCALQLTLYNNIPMAEVAGFPQVRHHCRQATENRKLCCMWAHRDLDFQRFGDHRIGGVI